MLKCPKERFTISVPCNMQDGRVQTLNSKGIFPIKPQKEIPPLCRFIKGPMRMYTKLVFELLLHYLPYLGPSVCC